MASNKRKSGDVFSQSKNGPSVVVVATPQSGGGSSSQESLQNIRRYLSKGDPLLTAMETIGTNASGPERELVSKVLNIETGLKQQLQQELDACEHETRALVDLEGRVEKMKLERRTLVQEMEALDKTQIGLQNNISKYQEEASREIDSIDQVEEEQKRLVPRLKTQISLYASTTGIRWDFAQAEILSGQVVRRLFLVADDGDRLVWFSPFL